jgi:hypothetical protein
MELRWNNARPDAGPEGKKAKPNASHNVQGLEIKERFSTSGRGTKMSLTSPLIDQAISLIDPSMSVTAILRRQSGSEILGKQNQGSSDWKTEEGLALEMMVL